MKTYCRNYTILKKSGFKDSEGVIEVEATCALDAAVKIQMKVDELEIPKGGRIVLYLLYLKNAERAAVAGNAPEEFADG